MTQRQHTRAAAGRASGMIALALASCTACVSASRPTHVASDPTLTLREGRAFYRLLTADRWRFAPARRQYRVAGLDLDHDGVADLPRWESEPMEAEANIQFHFEVELHQVRAPAPR